MPIVEELPDDYDLQADSSLAPGSADPTEAAAGIRRGFFNKPKEKPVPTASSSSSGAGATTSAAPARPSTSPPGAASAPSGSAQTPCGQPEACDAGKSGLEPSLERLRTRLLAAVEGSTDQGDQADLALEADDADVSALLAPLRSKWPGSQMKHSQDKAVAEIESALADMRAASNDMRRCRNGEERLAAAEVKRAAEDVMERVQKVADAAAMRELPKEDLQKATVAAFHALPISAKLRLLADDGAGRLLLASSMLMGATLMLGVLLEVYSGWNCGFSCAR